MPNNGYFSASRDRAIIEAGGFFCHACCGGKSSGEQSPDGRYCQLCYDILKAEAELLAGSKRPAWIPKRQSPDTTGLQGGKKAILSTTPPVLIMSPINGTKNEVDIINPPMPKRKIRKRGPKHRELPEDLIRQLASKGMRSKAIATELRSQGVTVSYKTIQRRLQGGLI